MNEEKYHDLPDKTLLRMDEVAKFFDVTERTIRNWIDHGQFEVRKVKGTIRIVRGSVIVFSNKIKKNR